MPSLREYAARYQIDAARLRPRQLLMHPGPVNRGVELSADVDRLAAGADRRSRSRPGVVVRMAVLYELLAGPAARPRPSPPAERGRGRMSAARLFHAPAAPADAADPRRPRARPARRPRRAARRARPRRRDRRARRPRHAARRPTGRRSSRARGCHLFPAFVDPHVHLRTPGQEHKEDLDTGTARRRGRRLLRGRRDAEHRRRRVDSAPVLRALREHGGARRARAGRLHAGDHARAGRRTS